VGYIWADRGSCHIPALLEVAVVKGEEILILIVQALDVVSYSLGEVPDITSLEDIGLESTVLINTGEQEGSIVDESPLGLYKKSVSIEDTREYKTGH
jgi:hypothetical protein